MTLKEAKKLLKKEMVIVFHSTEPFEFDESGWIEHEKPSVLEAFRVLAKEGYYMSISGHDYNMRKERLKKEYEENTKAPGSDENSIKGDLSGNESIEHCVEPIPGSPLSAVEGIKLKQKDNQNTTENPALAESATQFNDALLYEQAKKIKSLVKDITHMDNVIYKKNLEIDKQNQEITRLLSLVEKKEGYNLKQIKRLGKEIARLYKIIHEKKKVCCELVAENTDLKERLTDKDAVLSDVAEELRLSKIREKNLVEVSQKYMKENEELREKVAEKTKLVEMVRNASKEYCDYGVAANEFIKELASLYVLANNTGIINDEMLERCKNYQTYGFPANCNRETKKEINDIARGKTKVVGADIAEEGGDHSAIIAQCCKNIAISKEEAKIIERCTKNGTELHYSEKDGFTYTNMFGDEMPIICLRGLCQVFTDEEIKNMKK